MVKHELDIIAVGYLSASLTEADNHINAENCLKQQALDGLGALELNQYLPAEFSEVADILLLMKLQWGKGAKVSWNEFTAWPLIDYME